MNKTKENNNEETFSNRDYYIFIELLDDLQKDPEWGSLSKAAKACAINELARYVSGEGNQEGEEA